VDPIGIAIAANGDLLVVDESAFGGSGGVIRVDPVTGAQATVSSGNFFVDPAGIAIASNGDIIVADVNTFGVSPFNGVPGGAIIRVNPVTGVQTVVSSGGSFFDPAGVAVSSTDQLLVADFNSFFGGGDACGGGIGAVFRVDPSTGAQTVIAVGGPLTIGSLTNQVAPPRAVALESNGDILVTSNIFGRFDCSPSQPGAILRIDPATGSQTILSLGGLLVTPVGIAVVRQSAATNHAPTAICRDVIKSADSNCQAAVTPQEVNNGSFDPDGDPISLSLSPPGPFALGTTTVTLTVTDTKGASGTCTATVTVVDSTPPTITSCPASFSVIANLGSNSAVVTYAGPTASDNCSAAPVVCSPPSGSNFPVGTTTVTCTATDASGNTASCAFTVTVLTPQQATQSLVSSVNSLVSQGVLNQGEGNALTSKLQASINQMNNGNGNAARNQLQALINQVNALMNSGRLSASEGQALIDAANNLIAHIS
jgi:HYR domain/NHL repeat